LLWVIVSNPGRVFFPSSLQHGQVIENERGGYAENRSQSTKSDKKSRVPLYVGDKFLHGNCTTTEKRSRRKTAQPNSIIHVMAARNEKIQRKTRQFVGVLLAFTPSPAKSAPPRSMSPKRILAISSCSVKHRLEEPQHGRTAPCGFPVLPGIKNKGRESARIKKCR
jgi:hypothetical protein